MVIFFISLRMIFLRSKMATSSPQMGANVFNRILFWARGAHAFNDLFVLTPPIFPDNTVPSTRMAMNATIQPGELTKARKPRVSVSAAMRNMETPMKN